MERKKLRYVLFFSYTQTNKQTNTHTHTTRSRSFELPTLAMDTAIKVIDTTTTVFRDVCSKIFKYHLPITKLDIGITGIR